jgi:hypothetical protein
MVAAVRLATPSTRLGDGLAAARRTATPAHMRGCVDSGTVIGASILRHREVVFRMGSQVPHRPR